MRKRLVGRALSVIIAAASLAFVQSGRAQQQPVSAQRKLLDQYCVTCHNQRIKTAGLMLDKMNVDHPSEGAEVWEKVVRKLRGGMMPPQGMPRPDKPTTDGFISWLETS